jgi:hypothetical protein
VQDVIGFDPGKEYLLEAIKALAEETRHDPVKDWLEGRKWDGVRRLYNWLPRITGAPETRLFKKAGVAVVLGMVARALFPASKFDLCLVLEGQQGCGKSSLVRNLSAGPGEEYFVDAPGLIAMDNKTRAELITGKWVVELAELSGMARSETEGVKAFLSQASDQYRAAYAAVAGERARRCVFIATTNSQTYLPDSTGNRRFLPVPCEKIDIAAFVAERDQPFAEAYLLVKRITRKAQKSGQVRLGHALPHHLAARFGLPPSLWREASELADDRRVVDPVEDALPDVVEDLEKWSQLQLPDGRIFVRSADLLSNLRTRLGCYIRPNGLAGWMRSLGWSKVKYGSGSKQVRGYAK